METSREVVLVAGTESALLSGRKAQLLVWKREFASPERAIYLRSPEAITSPITPITFEQGAWQGRGWRLAGERGLLR